MTRVLVARQDNIGDVLLTGPAVRAVAARADEVVFLAGPNGAEAARLLPGVSDVVTWRSPWTEFDPPPVTEEDVTGLVKQLRDLRCDAALIHTSFHQSPLPLALVLRMAGVGWIGAISEDYPGSLLDLRHRFDADVPEQQRALSLAEAAGFTLPEGDDGALRVRDMAPGPPLPAGYVVVHPEASVPARAPSVDRVAGFARALHAAGFPVVVTGTGKGTTAAVAGEVGVDLGGRTSLRELAGVLAGAGAVVVPNTGPAHLAAAVGAPVVSLFSPVVSAARWAPVDVPRVLLGDQRAPCAGTRARRCPVDGHPCLDSITDEEVVAAVTRLYRPPSAVPRADEHRVENDPRGNEEEP